MPKTRKTFQFWKEMCCNNDMYRKCSEELSPSDGRLVVTGDYGGDGELGLTSNSDGCSVERKVSALEVLIEQHIWYTKLLTTNLTAMTLLYPSIKKLMFKSQHWNWNIPFVCMREHCIICACSYILWKNFLEWSLMPLLWWGGERGF